MIKIIAIITMLLDHIGQVFFPNIEAFTIIGRLALPLFAWGIATGFKRTSNFKMYAVRLFVLALISQYPHDLLFNSDYFNVCFTLLAGLLVLKLYEAKISYLLKIPAVIGILAIAHSMYFEYGIYGIALITIFYIFEGKQYLIILQAVVTVFGIRFYNYYPVQFVSILAVIMIALLQKYDFRINRIVQYGFYPSHILLLLLLKNILPI